MKQTPESPVKIYFLQEVHPGVSGPTRAGCPALLRVIRLDNILVRES